MVTATPLSALTPVPYWPVDEQSVPSPRQFVIVIVVAPMPARKALSAAAFTCTVSTTAGATASTPTPAPVTVTPRSVVGPAAIQTTTGYIGSKFVPAMVTI